MAVKKRTIPPKFRKRPIARAGVSKPRADSRQWIGIDLSLHTLALASLAWDSVLRKWMGPSFVVIRWNKNDHYFDRLRELSRPEQFIADLQTEMKLLVEPSQVYIAIEEPWPTAMVGRGNSNTLKQQAEMNGALMAGLLRYGFSNVYQINNQWWKQVIADDLGITPHWTSFGKGLEGKMRSKQWALDSRRDWRKPVPVWPDIIEDKKNGGRMPQPEESRAQPLQPDDRYDALAMAKWMQYEEPV